MPQTPPPSKQTANVSTTSDVVTLRSSDQILDRVKRLHPRRIDLSLGRMERLLERLDHPETKLPPVIHVAGTNGKGSTTAYLKAMLEAAGYGVHVYTSPHLVRFNERIQLAGLETGGSAKAIPESELAALLTECEAANGEAPITFFEITTACAFLAFSRYPADIVLLEVGLGGRLDATNVIDKPALTVLTPISIDHTQFLGEKLAGIADEKAGILKQDVPCIVAEQTPIARKQISARATEIGAPLLQYGQSGWQAEATAEGMTVTVAGRKQSCPKPALPGPHQIGNAGLAVAVLKNLPGFDVDEDAIAAGLAATTWPGRLQDLKHSRAAQHLPEGAELWLDGGHNAASAEVLAATLDEWQSQSPRPTWLVCGMLNVKDVSGFMAPFKGRIEGLYGLTIPGEENALAAQDISDQAQAAGLNSQPTLSVIDALESICGLSAHDPAPRVLICGSLYLAGSVLAHEQNLVKEPGEFSG
ncbi:MAG: bifunctional folylpolyglutamate synthase/dihydrofolate synthase [Alphaproteobacteria bacterium]|nr:bifunctional folylpolyglutamate synthase/dihydrofolate synthase [Alphaproteobacteria bacterium]MBT4965148.1 bifunctional folylpolyglutamate synthase/dihydrofolate synthase [Alphaproteobacteria bacterium]MBT5159461.1 bifunctional folylpolyglutamate synthase/dihydrofolate synthase [Alphaproteobacteria bacterium]MBT5918893.1 bifunctional folylpolyglutamate synthase/dihydrofolate synthase [Alphaproteobacteria bacterium]MBT6384169.1 bifunctional folylpolyglutamate synthase/dihydrofolate synthase 